MIKTTIYNISLTKVSLKVLFSTNHDDVSISRSSVVQISDITDVTLFLKDKRLFLLNQWLIDHATSKITKYSDLHKIINKSKVAQTWLQTANLKYAELTSMADWIIEIPEIRNSWNVGYLEDYAQFKVIQRKNVEEKKILSDNYRKNVDKSNDNFISEMIEIGKRSPLVLIEKITVDALPLHLYEPTLSMNEDDSKQELKNILNKYKQELAIKTINKDISLSELMDILKHQ